MGEKHPNDASVMGGFLFFRYLQKERSELLDFRPVGDKWQIVHGWRFTAERQTAAPVEWTASVRQ